MNALACLLQLAAEMPISPKVELLPRAAANEAVSRLRSEALD